MRTQKKGTKISTRPAPLWLSCAPHASPPPRPTTPWRRLPLEGAGPLQHRRRCPRPSCRRDAERRCADLRTRGWPRPALQLRRHPAPLQPSRQRAGRAGCGPRGDRVGILLPQSPETAIAHVAAYKSALVAIPLFVLFGEEALDYRLGDSGATALVTDTASLPKLARHPRSPAGAARDGRRCGHGQSGALDFATLLKKSSDAFTPVDTAADDPALIIYTSGTTGRPRARCTPIACCSAICPASSSRTTCSPSRAICSGRRPIGPGSAALLDVLLPSWHHGVPVLARRFANSTPMPPSR